MKDDEHVRGALVALDSAEALARGIRRDLRLRALRDQFALGSRPAVEDAPAESFTSYLWLPAWTWMMFAVLAVVVMTPIPSVMVGVMAVVAAVVALGVRTGLTVQAAQRLFQPDERAVRALQATLADAGRHLQSVGSEDPYRATPQEWVGGDPTASSRPWTKLAAIRRTAAAVRARALPAAKDDTTKP
jgi:hypothetical protein